VADGQIASIALSRGLKLATRNTKDFDDCGLDLIDPFR
jgi:predicted nucleic acid-binding protein